MGRYLSRTALIENRASGQLGLPPSEQGKQLAPGAGDDRRRIGGGHVHVHLGALGCAGADQLGALSGGGSDLSDRR